MRITFSNDPMQLIDVEGSKLCQTALQLFVTCAVEHIHKKVSGEITGDAVAIPACKRGQVHKKILYKEEAAFSIQFDSGQNTLRYG